KVTMTQGPSKVQAAT
nr:LIGA=44 kda intracellular growth antigen {N-terminal} [Legionella pneumophila, Peptide Partial, 15 aa] [Legionella pneumophila]